MSVMSADKDDRFVPVTELTKYPAPPRTRTYTPVEHTAVVDVIMNHARLARLTPAAAPQVLLAKKGARMFGIATFEHPDGVEGRVLSVGFRNSYDKSTSLGVATGQTVVVCSNMCFSGRDATFMRKHTGNALVDFSERVSKALAAVEAETAKLDQDFARLAAKPCSIDDGYGVLGRALGHNVLTQTQAGIAFREWRRPTIEEHAQRNGWGLYNAFTQGLKHGQVDMADYSRVHDFIVAQAA